MSPAEDGRRELVVVATLMVASALVLGGVHAPVRAALAAALALLVACEWLPRCLRGVGPDAWERAWLAPWAVVTMLVVLQLAPFGALLGGHLGAHPPLLLEVEPEVVRRISPHPLATAQSWATFTGYWALAFTVARLPRQRARRLGGVLLALAAFEAFYGTHALARGSDRVLNLWPRTAYPDDATGTFVNRNHFAALLALAWPVGLAWLWPLGSTHRDTMRPLGLAAALTFSLLIGAALVSSHSRAGLVAALFGLAVWLALERRALRALPVPLVAAVAAALGGAIWFGSGAWIERALLLPQDGERFAVWRALLDLPSRAWILGAGLGSFGDVFKTVQPPGILPSYDHAHNEWLELLLELGALGCTAAGLSLAWWWWRARPPAWSRLQRGASAGLAAVVVHSCFDFGLRVPGVALSFWALLGILANPALATGERDAR